MHMLFLCFLPILLYKVASAFRKLIYSQSEDLEEGLHFEYCSREEMSYLCRHGKDCIDCYIEPWRSVVKVESRNMIRPRRNLQLQIVWN